ncbi:hypothetical protein PRIPAC_89559, partial [Pristionchus pacificus]|uniref:Uncharacterized protein n=1 Tax=Pristionchus pacificus TaxID=54126 RepID=A0A8R1V2U6_PRIPA
SALSLPRHLLKATYLQHPVITITMHLTMLILATSVLGFIECLSKSDIERRVLARGWRFAAPTRALDAPDAPEADADAPRVRTFVRQAHLQWEHDEVDSRAVSENVDLDKVDDGGFERLRRALHSMHPRVGVRLWKREALPWGVDQ